MSNFYILGKNMGEQNGKSAMPYLLKYRRDWILHGYLNKLAEFFKAKVRRGNNRTSKLSSKRFVSCRKLGLPVDYDSYNWLH